MVWCSLVKLLLVALQVLATKMVAIMELSQQQLSKQDHYNYGLRSFIIPIARAAGESNTPPAAREMHLAFDACRCHRP